jgi:pimeloyl-ACP methyl ester carboxylesterase
MTGRDYVLVAGAWQGAWLWESVSRELTAAGHRVHAVTLSGLAERAGADLASIGPRTHLDDVLTVLESRDLHDVILVGHLYGGVVVGQVADRAPERVARVVYVEAFLAGDGRAMLDSITPDGRACELAGIAEHGGRWPPPTAEDLSHEPDLTPEQRAWLTEHFTDHPGRTVAEPLSMRRPLSTQPTTYIATTGGSHSPTAEVQAMRSEPRWSFRTLEAGHWPMVTVPGELVRMLVDATATEPVGRRYPGVASGAATAWTEAAARLAAADGYWLASTQPDGRPHLVPVLAVWVDEALHLATGPGTRKGRNLRHDPHCVLSTRQPELDLVVEGVATRVADEAVLRRVAEEYAAKYAWPADVRDGALDGEGAPTAGPPPYEIHRLDPAIAFGFPTDDTFAPTRWEFR